MDNATWKEKIYQADVNQLRQAGFHGVKLDDCGDGTGAGLLERVKAINASGKAMLIENSDVFGTWKLTGPIVEVGQLLAPVPQPPVPAVAALLLAPASTPAAVAVPPLPALAAAQQSSVLVALVFALLPGPMESQQLQPAHQTLQAASSMCSR